MRNLKGQALILTIVIITVVSAVAGYFYLQNRDLKSQLESGNEVANPPLPSKPVEVNPSTTLTQPTAVPTDETANWKTYTNEQAGYSLKYPDTWNFLARSEGCGPVFSPPGSGRMQIWLTICGLYINSTDTPQNLAKGAASSTVVNSEVTVTIDKHQGIRQELSGNNQMAINVFIGDVDGLITYAGGETKKEKGTLGIYYYIKDLTKIDSAKHDLDQILSTFKFL